MPTPPTRRRLSPAEREAQITEAAVVVARTDGLTAVTLRGVAAAVGVAPSLVAHYRPSMEELVGDTFRSIASAEVAEVARLVAHEADPVAQLAVLVAAVTDPARDDVAVLWADAWSLGRTNDVLAAAARDVNGRVAAARDRHRRRRRPSRSGACRGSVGGRSPLFALVDATNGYALVDYLDRSTRDDLVRSTIARAVGLDAAALRG